MQWLGMRLTNIMASCNRGKLPVVSCGHPALLSAGSAANLCVKVHAQLQHFLVSCGDLKLWQLQSQTGPNELLLQLQSAHSCP